MENIINKTTCKDAPDLRDWKLPDSLFGSNQSIESCFHPWIFSLNQGNTSRCTAYGLCHTALATLRNYKQEGLNIKDIDPVYQWGFQVKTGGTEGYGDFLQNALKQAKKNGFKIITKNETDKSHINYKLLSYYKINNDGDLVKRMESVIFSGKAIYTGAKIKGYSENKYIADITVDGYGHAFCITGFDKYYFYVLNSYGKDWGIFHNPQHCTNFGYFRIKKDDVKLLFSKYTLEFE